MAKTEQELDKVVIWNRTDSGLQGRLSDFRVSVLDEKRGPTWDTEIGPAPNPTPASTSSSASTPPAQWAA